MAGKTVGRLDIRIQAKHAKADRDIDRLQRSMEGLERDARQAGRGFKKFDRQAGRSMKNVRQEATRTQSRFGRFKGVMTAIWAAIAVAVGAAVGKVIEFMRDSVKEAEKLQRSFLRLKAASKLFGVSQEFMVDLSSRARKEFKLTTGEANSLAVEVTKLASKAEQTGQSWQLLASALDLGAAQGMNAQEVAVALNQTLRGLDEGTDKLFQKNPSTIYEEYARSLETTAGKLTEVQKKQALVNEFLEQGGKVAGEYGRFLESDIGRLTAWRRKITEAKQSIGMALLPTLARLVNVFEDDLDDATQIVIEDLKQLATWVEENEGDIERVAGQLGGLAQSIGKIAGISGRLIEFTVRVTTELAGSQPAQWLIGKVSEGHRRIAGQLSIARDFISDPEGWRANNLAARLVGVGPDGLRAVINEATLELQRVVRSEIPEDSMARDFIPESFFEAIREGAIEKAREEFEKLPADIQEQFAGVGKKLVVAEDLIAAAQFRLDQVSPDTVETPARQGGAGGGDSSEDEGPGQISEEAEEAREKIDELIRRYRLLQSIGAEGMFGALPEEVASAVSQLEAQEEAVDAVTAAIKTYRDRGEEVPPVLREIQAALESDAEAARKLAEEKAAAFEGMTPEMVAAKQRIEEVGASAKTAADLGFGALADASPKVRETVQAVGELDGKIEQLEEDLAALGDRAPAYARKLLQSWKEQRKELIRMARAVEGLPEAVQEVSGIGGLFEDLNADEAARLTSALRDAAPAIREVAQAQRALEQARALGDEEAAEEATERLTEAKKGLRRELRQLIPVLRRLGISEKKITAILTELAGASDDAADGTSDLVSTLEEIEGLARGVLSVADALGVLSDGARQALGGVVDLASGIKDIASGNLIGGIAKGIGGVVDIIGGLFSDEPTPEEKEAMRVRKENTAALERLRNNINKVADVVSGTPGNILVEMKELFAEFDIEERRQSFDNPDGFLSGLLAAYAEIEELMANMASSGMSTSDLEQFAQEAGVTIDILLRQLRNPDIKLKEGEFDQLLNEIETLDRAMAEMDLEKAFEGFTNQLETLRREFELFDIDDPAKKVEKMLDLLMEYSNVEEAEGLQGLLEQMKGFEGVVGPDGHISWEQVFDMSTPEGRKAAEKLVQRLFEGFRSGKFDEEMLGEGLTLDQLMQLLSDIEGTLDTVEGEEGEAASSQSVNQVTGISSIQANQLLSYQSTIAARVTDIARAVVGRNGQVTLPPPPTTDGAPGSPRSYPLGDDVLPLPPQGQLPEVYFQIERADFTDPGAIERMSREMAAAYTDAVIDEIGRRMASEGAPRGSRKTLKIPVK